MLAFCYSLNSDVSMMLRRCGLFSIMIINHDIKMLTKNPEAKLNENQRKLMEDIGRQFVWLNTYLKTAKQESILIFCYFSCDGSDDLHLHGGKQWNREDTAE